ncbi:MAG: lysophospholipid acyltransferase family protein [Alphaproteobacteria bacterium]
MTAVSGVSSPWRAAWRLACYLCLTLVLMPVQAALVATRSRHAVRLPTFYHRLCWRILGIEVDVRGAMSGIRPTLFTCNHSSYLDIMVLGGLIPGCFVSKAEVANWPLFGQLARLQRTVFIERQARRAADHRDALQRRLEAGDNLILFPEGTSSDGNRVLPFKSALFSVAERRVDGAPLAVQPVSIAYARLDGMPVGYMLRPLFAWYGDMDLAPHLWRMAGCGRLTVVVEFHPVVSIGDWSTRREMAAACGRRVAAGLAAALHGAAGGSLDTAGSGDTVRERLGA